MCKNPTRPAQRSRQLTRLRPRATKPARIRPLLFETYESRTLLAADFGGALAFGSPNSSGATHANEIETDADGNYYLAGSFSGTVDFDPGPAVTSLTSAGVEDAFVAKYAADGTLQWARGWGGIETDRVYGLAVDLAGNVFVSGQFQETVDFDPGSGVSLRANQGILDVFAVKLDAVGNLVFAHTWGGHFVDQVRDIGVDAAGNLYVLSDFHGNVDFDPSSVSLVKTSGSAGGGALTLTKYNPSGALIGLSLFEGTASKNAGAFAVTPSGEVYLSGEFVVGTLDLDPGPGVLLKTATGFDSFLVRLDANFNLVYGHALDDLRITDLAVDANGQAIITGSFAGTFDFDLGAGVASRTSAGSTDAFVLQLTSSGAFDFVATMGGAWNDVATEAVVTPNGEILVAGEFVFSGDFDPGAGVTNLTNAFGFSPAGFLARLDENGALLQARSIDGQQGTVIDLAVATDAQGNAFVSGGFSGMIDADPGPLNDFRTGAGLDLFVLKLDSLGNRTFAQTAGSPRTGDDRGKAVAVDAGGNVYLAGTFSNTVDFDPGPGEALLTANGGPNSQPDSFVAKYGPGGNLIWARGWGSATEEDVTGVAVDPNGNVYVSGLFTGAVDFDPGASTQLRTPAEDRDLYLLKLDASGGFVSVATYGSDIVFDYGSLTSDLQGNVYLAGVFSGTVDFDPGPGLTSRTAVGPIVDAFVAKYTAAGALDFVATFSGPNEEKAQSVAVDFSGNVYVSGISSGTADLDPGPGVVETDAEGSGFVVKLTPSGALAYAAMFTGSGVFDYATGNQIAVDGSGNAYVLGEFQGTVDFDPGPGIVNRAANGVDLFIAKIDSLGNLSRIGQVGGQAHQFSKAMAVDPAGNVYFSGISQGTAEFMLGPNAQQSNHYAFLAQWTAAGDLGFVQPQSEAPYQREIEALTVDPAGNLWLTGWFAGEVDFDPSPGEFKLHVSGPAASDIFLQQLLTNANGSLIAAIDGGGNLVISDQDEGGKNNEFTIHVADGNLVITDKTEQFHAAPAGGTLSNGNRTLTMPLTQVVGAVIVDAQAGDDLFLVGDLGDLRELRLDAGSGSDQIGTAEQRIVPSKKTRIELLATLPMESIWIDIRPLAVDTPAIVVATTTFGAGQIVARGYQPFRFPFAGIVNTQTISGTANGQQNAVIVQGTDRGEVATVTLASPGNEFAGMPNQVRIGDLRVPAPAMTQAWFFGGSGNDMLVNRMPEILWRANGDAGDDFLIGGDRNDVLMGGDGFDRLFGHGGNDYLNAEAGSSFIAGGSGNDRLHGGDGSDAIFGEDGNDILVSHGSQDVLHGGSGHDFIIAGNGGDLVNGGLGNDLLISGEMNNSTSTRINDANDVSLMAMLGQWSTLRPAGLVTSVLSADDLTQDLLFGELGDDDFYVGPGDVTPDYGAAGFGLDRRVPEA